MKKTALILCSLFILAIVAGTVSCSKKRFGTTIAGNIVGKWKKIQYATDDNENGTIDALEVTTQESNIDDELYFAGDGTGNETTIIDKNKGDQLILNFHWDIVGDSLYMAYAANDTISYTVQSINSANLALITKNNNTLAWYNYSKQ